MNNHLYGLYVLYLAVHLFLLTFACTLFIGPGSSNNPCSDTYHGGSAFSAPETEGLKKEVEEFGSRVFAFFSIHCYSQFMLIPYGYKITKPANYAELVSI